MVIAKTHIHIVGIYTWLKSKGKWKENGSAIIGTLRGATWPLKHFAYETVRLLIKFRPRHHWIISWNVKRQKFHRPRSLSRTEGVHLLLLLEQCVQRRECSSRPRSSTCTDTGDEVGRGPEFVVIRSFRKWSPGKEPGERAPANKHLLLRRKDSESLEP